MGVLGAVRLTGRQAGAPMGAEGGNFKEIRPISIKIRCTHTNVAGQTTYVYDIIEPLYLTKLSDNGIGR